MESLVPQLTLKEELDKVQEVLSIGTLRLEGRIQWECTIDPQVNTGIRIPASLVLGFVEHALRYGHFLDARSGKIEVSVHHTQPGILIMVTNSGLLNESSVLQKGLEGNRLELLDHHIQVFNRERNTHISYQILDVAYSETVRNGTRVLITINL